MDSSPYSIEDLIYLMSRLRDPETGCPWDIRQNYLSITPSTIEEAYEVVDAIEQEDYPHLKEELGDLLFQVIFYTQLASEESRFDFAQVVDRLTAKLLRRHPHVFPDGTLASRRPPDASLTEAEVNAQWEAIKQQERSDKGRGDVFADIPASLPALTRAAKLQKRAAKYGFDWPDITQVYDKISEESIELKEALADKDEDAVAEELGDLMFSCVNMSRHLGREPEALMRAANRKFEQRFQVVAEHISASGEEALSLEQLELAWQAAKQRS